MQSGSSGPGGRPQGTGYGTAADGAARLGQANSLDASRWSADSHSVLRVKIADEYRLDPLVQVPASLEASSRPRRDFDFDYERKVMQQDEGGLADRFLQKQEDTYYAGTKVAKYLGMGYTPAAVHLALAYQAATRSDESQVVEFCNNYTQLVGMGFSPATAAGALVRSSNKGEAAAELCLAASGQ